MKNLATLRKEHGLSQQKLASDIGLARNTICQYESGNRVPDVSTLVLLADYFGVSTDYLLGREQEAPHETELGKNNGKVQPVAEKYPIYPSRKLIAFIDVLATKEMNKKNTLLITNLLKDTYDSFRDNLNILGIKSDIQVKCFSDNIVFSCEYNEKNSIAEISNMLQLLSDFQLDLLRRRVLCRGYFDIGDLYIDDTFVMGSGLIDAYMAENEKVFFPRIAISEKIMQLLKLHSLNKQSYNMIRKDFDKVYFVNFLSGANGDDHSKVIETVRYWLNENHDERAVKKNLWLKNYSDNIKNGTDKGFSDFWDEHQQDIKEIIVRESSVPAIFEEMNELLKEQRFVDIAKIYRKIPDELRERAYGLICGIAIALGLNLNDIIGR